MLRQRLEDVRERIQRAAARSGRPADSVILVAVTKTVPVEAIREALALGVADVGENRVQEAMMKHAQLAGHPGSLRWHLVGSLQRNKAKQAAELFDTVQSVDSRALIETLEAQAVARRRQGPLDVLLQVNVSGEASKHGCSPEELAALARVVREAEHLTLRGLMTMVPWHDDPEQSRPHYRRLRELRDGLDAQLKLSMGMSGDFEVAIEEGADYVRIGTAIFGARST